MIRRRHRVVAGLVATVAVGLTAAPAFATESSAKFSGAIRGRAKGGAPECYTVVRPDGRARFMALDAFRVGRVRYSMQAGFFGPANEPGRQDLVDDAPPGATVILVRSRDGRQWASARGHVTLSDDGATAQVRATLEPSVPRRGRSMKVSAVIACETVADLPDPAA